MFGPRRSTNFLMAKKTPLALSWKSFSQRSYLCETFGWVNTQIKPEVATSCFVPDTCGVAWSVRLTADSRAAWSGISAFRDISSQHNICGTHHFLFQGCQNKCCFQNKFPKVKFATAVPHWYCWDVSLKWLQNELNTSSENQTLLLILKSLFSL